MPVAAAVITRAFSGSLRKRDACRLALTASACLLVLAVFSSSAFATDYTVTKTADTNDGNCNADCSLREAIAAANASGGADHVVLGSGQTYVLSAFGRVTVTDALTIDGNGSTVNGAGLDRVFDILGVIPVTMNGLTITGGVASGFLSLGGGLNIRGATVTLNNCTVTGNSTALESGARDDGGGIAVIGSYNAAAGTVALASLTLNNTTVSNNMGSNGGGVVCVLCSLVTSKSAISGNTAIGGDGGGLDVVGNGSTATMNSSALVSNTVSGGAARGGGLSVPFGVSATTLSLDRIVSNTGTVGSAIFNNVGTITATNDWWGCNLGPGAAGAGCSATTNGASGTVTTSPYLTLRVSALPVTLTPGGVSTATADLTFNSSSVDTSAGGTVPDGTIAAFSGTLGTFATPSSLTTSGKATDVYTAGGAFGTASLSAIVDSQTVSVSMPIAGCQTITLSATTFVSGTAGAAYPPTTLTQTGALGMFTFALRAGALPSGMMLSSTGTVSGTPTETGNFNFTGTVTDANGCAGWRTYPLTIAPGSQLTLSSIANTTTRRNTPVAVGFTVTNLGSGSVSAVSSNTTLVPNTNLGVGGSGANRTLNVTPTTGQIGTTTITVTASVGGTTASRSFVLLVYASTPGDFDGDGKTDITVFRPSNGTWFVLQSSTNFTTWVIKQWGIGADVLVPGDYDGDGKADIANYRPSEGTWHILQSSTNFTTWVIKQWGLGGDVPEPGDYDGDGQTDIAIYRPSEGTWYILQSSTNFTTWVIKQWGISGDLPEPGDYDGDGKTDIAIYRPSDGTWFVLQSSTNFTTWIITQWGLGGDVPEPGDYDGDGRPDLTIYRPSTGTWYLLQSSTNFTTWVVTQWGISGDAPVLGDYDGDGKTDLAVYRPSTGFWYVLQSSTSYTTWLVVQWGIPGDIPVFQGR